MFHSPWNRLIQRTSKARSPIRSRRSGRQRATLRLEELEARTLMNATNEQYVLRLYDDLLERPADPSGLQSWNALLDRGASRIQVAEGFLGSAEHQTQQIGNLYESLLKRAPDPLGLSGSLQFLQTGGRSDQLEALILGSPEYFSDTGASANSFLVSLYHEILGRPIDPSGLASFTNALQSGVTRTQVALTIVDSPEARGIQVNGLYVRFLDRDADSSGLQAFLNALGQGAPPETIEAAIVGSSEYFNDFVATPAPPVTDRSALTVPGTTGQIVTVTFTASGVSTAYANEFGIFPVDDATGRIGTLEPSDPGYESAALTEPGSRVVFAQPPTLGETTTVNLPGGSFLGLYIVPNGTTAEAVANNPADQLGQLPFVYFSFASANPDRFEHIHQTGNQFAFEDLFGGGDQDFNDLVVTFSQPSQMDHNPPVVRLTSPSNGLVTRQNPTVNGQAVDDQSGVASVEAEVDGGAPFPVPFDSSGNFSFATSLALGGSADGVHNVAVSATDNAGNVSSFVSTSFALDTVPPTIEITGPASGLLTNQNVDVTGSVSDLGSGVASLRAQVDGGPFANVSFDAAGDFSFPTSFALDGSADGAHTVQLQATDRAGNASALVGVSFVLNTSVPMIQILSPTAPETINTNATIVGRATDDRSGLAEVDEQVDGGAFTPLSFDSSGNFAFATSLALDGSADGTHTVEFKAINKDGVVSPLVDYTFTLDTIPPAVEVKLDPAFDTGNDHTTDAAVTLTGITEPNTPVLLQQMGVTVTSDSVTGVFSFTNVPVSLGPNNFTVQATDEAGNVGSAQVIVTRDETGTTLVEGTRFATPFQYSFTVPSQPSELQFTFGNLDFDTTAQFIKDAFEASLTDSNGNSLVLPISSSQDAFLNISEGQAPVISPNVQLNNGTVDVDLSHITPGTQATLTVRLVNNDSDTATTVHISNPQIISATMNTPAAVTPAVTAPVASEKIGFSGLSDVSTSMTAVYGETSLDRQSNVLLVGLAVQNTGTYPVDAPLVAVITNLSDPSVRVRNSDGLTPGGLPYYDLSGFIGGNTLAPGQSTAGRTLTFYDPDGIQFTYELQILGQLNRPPTFTSNPNSEAIPGVAYVYQATASDPDNDALTFSLLTGPAGMSVDPSSGKVTWSPQTSDVGNQAVLLQVDDGHGGKTQQQYTVSTIVAPPNRPPLFTSTPVVVGNVNTPYVYQATAADPDGDPLSYSLGAPPVAVAVTNPSFEAQVLADGFASSSIPGWTIVDSGGTFNPSAGEFTGGVPDGQNVAFSNGGTIAQVLTEPLTAGTRYVLQVDVGHRQNVSLAPFSVELWAGGFLAGASTPAPAAGSFATVTVTYDAPANSPLLGQFLEIRLISNGTQVCFDNVRLSAAASAAISGMAIDAGTGLVTWTPSIDQIGQQPVALQVTDGRGGVALQTFAVNVLQDPADHPPEIVSQPVTEIESPLPAPNAQRTTIDFEGLPAAPSFIEGSTIPLADTLSDQLLQTDGVEFRSGSGVPYIAVVTLGLGHATSGTNGIGGMSSATILDYATPIIAEFFLPNDSTTLAATDFVSIRPDNIGDGRTITLEGFDANGQLLATTSAVDMNSPVLSLSTPGIHSIMVLGTSTTAFDDLTFAQLYAAPAYRYDVKAIDPDGDPLTYSLTTAPTGMVINSATGVITWSPPATPASDPVTVRVEDGRGGFDTQSFNVVVDQAGTGQIQGAAFNDLDASGSRDPLEPALPGRLIYLDLNHNGIHDADEPSATTDANGDYSLVNLTPAVYSVAMEGQSGSLQTLPAADTYVVTVDPEATVSGIDFGATTIAATARPPVITSTAPTVAAVGQPYRYAVTVRNPDGVALQFDMPVAPDGMTIDSDTGVIAWTPSLSQVGSQDAIVRLRDARGDVVSQAFQVTVSVETAPIITSTPPNPAVTLLPYQYQVVAQDAENDPLTYSLVGGPLGMTIDSATGVLSWTGAAIGPGLPVQFPVTVEVSDGRGGQDTQSYTLLVVADPGDQAPVITSSPDTSVALGHNYFYAVQATDADGDPLAYDLPTAPAGMTIDAGGVIRWTPGSDQFGSNDVTVRVEDGRGGVATQAFTVDVTAQPNSQPPSITSTPPLAATLGRGYAYDATGVDVDGSALVWRLLVAPAGMSIDPMRGRIRWSPTADQLGSQQVVIGLTNAGGKSTTQSFTIQVRAIDVPPVITSTPPTQGAAGQAYTYAVSATDADGDPLTYSLTAFDTGMTIDAATGLIQWTPTAQQIGIHIFAVAVDDGQGGTATQNWLVVVGSQPLNQPPIITSSPPLAAGLVYQYPVVATDPEGSPVIFSLLQAPGGMSIDSASGLIQWTPTAAQVGTNNVTVAATDPQGASATQTFSIVVIAINHAPTIISTPPTTAVPGMTFHYDVHAVDADGDSLVYTLTTAPAGMTIDSLGRIIWLPQAGDVGSQPVAVSVSDGRGGSDNQQFTLTVGADTDAPQVMLTLSANPADLGTPDLAVVTATDNVGVTLLTLTLNGTPVAIDSMGRATLPDATAGVFTLIATASDAACNVGTTSQTLTVINPQVTNAPVVALTSPADNDMISAPTQVIGTVQDPNLVSYTLSVAPMGSDSFTTFFTGTSQVSNGVLGTLDPTMLQDDSYDLRLVATNTGGVSAETDVTVNVSSNLKLGDFKLSFTDLTIPVSGIPITVTRTYESLNANESEDFGFGWQLEYRDTDLQTSVPSTGDEADDFYNPFQVGTHVYITLPGGHREGFDFEPSVAPGLEGSFLGIFQPTFVPDPGVTDTLTVPAAALRIDSDGTVIDYTTGEPYNPASPLFGTTYLVTTTDGLAYGIDANTGQLTAVSDRNNNTLTFSDSGVSSSSGAGIRFERDAQGRIAAIVDPMGNVIHYQYDASGDLVAVTDRTGDTTQFSYLSSPAHYLNQVIDPLGRTGVRTEYDAQGRLAKIFDAAGNPVALAYDPKDLIETATDQNGNTVTDEYDAQGNLLRETDAMGNVTARTFDANNNMLTETDPLGQTTSFTYDARGDMLTQTDPLGNTTISTFQAFTFGTTVLAAAYGQASAPFTNLDTTTDALGNTTTYDYSPIGNPGTVTDPTGQVTQIAYAPSGNPTGITNADGNTTQYFYDGANNVILEVDPLGNATQDTYDADGNELTRTTTQTAADGTARILTTQTQYDAQGRVIAVTDPDGGVTRTEYDAAGNVTATIDPLGHMTQYVYNDRNELIETIYPDNTPNDPSDNPTTQYKYDAVGKKIAEIDEEGRETDYQYDADNRLIKTAYPDRSSTQTEYDADGQATAQIDELGNRTQYSYDADGNQTTVRDALGDITTDTFDAAGRRIAQTDALGHTTSYVFDARGFLVETDYPDGTKTSTTYDNAGLPIAQTDQLGRTTQYAYDADGRLITVTDALGHKTEYANDEEGDLISQTDANGNTTQYAYNGLGQQTETILPAIPGQAPFTSTAQYDAAGNDISTTDNDGNTITYSYDARNRLVAKDYPDGTSVTYTYTLSGQLASVTDSRGATDYTYDARDRLLSTTEPDGTEISYVYDADGDRTALTTPAGTTTYAFDQLGQVKTVTDSGGVTRYTYDAAGNPTQTVMPNGVVETRSYDDLNRLTFLEDQNTAGTVLASYTYTLGATGLLDSVVENTGREVDYTYDSLDRLTEEKIIDAIFGNRTIDYTYDADGNRLTMNGSVDGLTSYSYDALDRLTTATLAGQVTQYVYDKNGNMLSSVSPTGSVFYKWDFDDRLISADTNGDGVTDEVNVYDPEGNLVAQTIGGQETRYLVDTVQTYPQVVLEYRPGGLIVASYVYGQSLISQDRGGVRSYYLVDALGSTRELTDSAGTVTDSYIYDAFGRMLHQSGNTTNAYLFAGERQDSTSGLDYLRARFLDPMTGRFLSADSFLGNTLSPLTLNRYIYTAQDPVNRTDPSGHFFQLFIGSADAIIEEAVEGAEDTVEYTHLVNVVKELSDFLFLANFGLAAAAAYFGFKSGAQSTFDIVERSDGVGQIKGAEFKLTAQGPNLVLGLEIELKQSPKFNFSFNLVTGSAQFDIGQEFHLQIAQVFLGPLPIIDLYLVVEPQFLPAQSLNFAVEGRFARVLKEKVQLFNVTVSKNNRGAKFF